MHCYLAWFTGADMNNKYRVDLIFKRVFQQKNPITKMVKIAGRWVAAKLLTLLYG